jgi:hypothetical protein
MIVGAGSKVCLLVVIKNVTYGQGGTASQSFCKFQRNTL